MVLPLIAAYGLFIWINAYYEEKNVAEYMDIYIELNQLQEVLAVPTLYRTDADFSKIDAMKPGRVSITLYNDIGFMLYSTNPIQQTPLAFIPKKQLYEGFYEQREKFGTIRYKEPVFTGNTLTGVYEIEWTRDEWVTGVSQRTWLIAALCVLFFLVMFSVVKYSLNRKLNRPLKQLVVQMDAFAKGLPVVEILKSNDELGELTKSFEVMRAKLIEANQKLTAEQQQKEFMVASISHDLKTPLTSIRAYAEALESDELSHDQRQAYRQVIVEKSVFMHQMLDDLLMYTLLQSNAYTMDFVVVDGEEFFDMLVSGYETLCREKGIQFHEMTHVSGTYEVDAKQLIRVVDNLMANAMKYTASGHKAWLGAVNGDCMPDWCFDFVKQSLHETDGMYLIVQNEGEGISEEQLKNLFEPLYRANEARTKAENHGTGLGLSITKQLIEKHGGKVFMLSKENIGTAVICSIPNSKGEER